MNNRFIKKATILKYIICIGIILLIVLASQAAYFAAYSKKAQTTADEYWQKSKDYVAVNFASQESTAGEQGTNMEVQAKAGQGNIFAKIYWGISNYFSNLFSGIFKKNIQVR